jgi:lycopene beta-cyclase
MGYDPWHHSAVPPRPSQSPHVDRHSRGTRDRMAEPVHTFDLVLVGGGLQNALIALARTHADPAARIALIERDGRFGGNHTWCFHAGDVPIAARPFVDPLIEYRWDGYDVLFPSRSREIRSRYAGLSSAHLARVVEERLGRQPGCALLRHTTATRITGRQVTLQDGRTLEGALVVDARGPEPSPPRGTCGFQKFVGQEFQTTRPHGLARPIVMDARVPQTDGFRFFYVLPLAPDRLLIEDTRFSDRPDLDRDALRAEIGAYAAARGLGLQSMIREEEGVLAMPWTGAGPSHGGSPVVAGYRGGWAHPATGYSFPLALRLALLVGQDTGGRPGEAVARLARQLRPQMRFARLLNRLLFRWYLPDQRRDVFDRFYRLPEPAIRRFYALRTTRLDRARMLVGRPPRGLSLRARLSAVERLDAGPPR